MLNDIASNTSFFGIFITGVAYVLACAIQKRFKSSILNPLLVSCVILIIFMLVSGIDYNVYLVWQAESRRHIRRHGCHFLPEHAHPHHRLPCHPVV